MYILVFKFCLLFLTPKYPKTSKSSLISAIALYETNFFRLLPFTGKNQLPVERVSWDDAVEFCQRLSKQTGNKYRLPSEAEWEYACRARTTTPFHFGEKITDKLANYGKTMMKTTSVGKFPPNAFGLYDMHGNVWEWCQDNWHNNYESAPKDGSAWISSSTGLFSWLFGGGNIRRVAQGVARGVARGGSWYDYPDDCRSAFRSVYARDGRDLGIGFRVVRVAPRVT